MIDIEITFEIPIQAHRNIWIFMLKIPRMVFREFHRRDESRQPCANLYPHNDISREEGSRGSIRGNEHGALRSRAAETTRITRQRYRVDTVMQ